MPRNQEKQSQNVLHQNEQNQKMKKNHDILTVEMKEVWGAISYLLWRNQSTKMETMWSRVAEEQKWRKNEAKRISMGGEIDVQSLKKKSELLGEYGLCWLWGTHVKALFPCELGCIGVERHAEVLSDKRSQWNGASFSHSFSTTHHERQSCGVDDSLVSCQTTSHLV